jgi:alpha 1,2-mannosyltransferase
MGVRRYSCFIFQLAIGAYIIGALFYFIARRNSSISIADSSSSTSLWDARIQKDDISRFNPHFADQPDSYTINPEGLPFKERVALPPATNATERQAAAFIVLVRNSELAGMIQSMHDVGKMRQILLHTRPSSIIYFERG